MARYTLAIKYLRKILNSAVFLMLFIPVSWANSISGLVVKVYDGDTLTILAPLNQQIKIRLADIDAPERKQAFGQRSRQSLAELCFRKNASVQFQKKDRYQRILGRVYCNAVDVNAEQVRRGLAWVYDKYVADKSLYQLQAQARKSKAGLWIDPDPVPPWEFRKK